MFDARGLWNEIERLALIDRPLAEALAKTLEVYETELRTLALSQGCMGGYDLARRSAYEAMEWN